VLNLSDVWAKDVNFCLFSKISQISGMIRAGLVLKKRSQAICEAKILDFLDFLLF